MSNNTLHRLAELANMLDSKGFNDEATELDCILKEAGDAERIEEYKKSMKDLDDRIAYAPPEMQEALKREKIWLEYKLYELQAGAEGLAIDDTIENWFHSYGNRITGNSTNRGEKITTSEIVNVDGDVVVTYSGSRYRLGSPDKAQAIVELRLRLSERGK